MMGEEYAPRLQPSSRIAHYFTSFVCICCMLPAIQQLSELEDNLITVVDNLVSRGRHSWTAPTLEELLNLIGEVVAIGRIHSDSFPGGDADSLKKCGVVQQTIESES